MIPIALALHGQPARLQAPAIGPLKDVLEGAEDLALFFEQHGAARALQAHEENLRPMAQWLFTSVLDPDKIKHELYSTKVMGYSEETRESYSRGSTSTRSGPPRRATRPSLRRARSLWPSGAREAW